MATIQQLWNFGGRMGKLKVRRDTFKPGTYLEVMDIRNDTVIGWLCRDGHKPVSCDTYFPIVRNGNGYADWQIYKTPTHKKVDLYAAIIKGTAWVDGRPSFRRSVDLFESEAEARDYYGDEFIKLTARVTDVEVPL